MINKILFIGDPHFKINNNDITDVFIEECLKTIDNLVAMYSNKEIICVLGGDILDTHERLHQTPYNKALDFITKIKSKILCVILVGNHDYENNQQFLTNKHWMNPLKHWENVIIVDKVINLEQFVFVPYVPVGRFMEALETLDNIDWRTAKCIFAHQEFKGCKLNNITLSEHGDKWPLHYPLVISGHIHKYHQPQENILYPGSVIQHNFGEENNKNIILLVDFLKEKNCMFTQININVPTMYTIKINCEDFDKTMKNLKIKPLQRVRIVCNGTDEQFKRIRKTTLYNNLPIGVNINFKNKACVDIEIQNEFKSFDEILNSKINNNYELTNILSMTLYKKSFLEITQFLEKP